MVLKRHPGADRPLIDYQTALLMEPMALIGSVFGVFFNVIFPEYIILICLVVLLTATAYKTFQKGITTYKKEKATQAPKPQPIQTYEQFSVQNAGETQESGFEMVINHDCFLDDDCEDGEHPVSMSLPKPLPMEEAPCSEVEKIYKNESHTPLLVLLALFFTWLVFVVAIFLAGAKGKSVVGIECGTYGYWLLLAFAFVFLTCVTALQATRMVRLHYRKVSCGYKFIEGDIHWDRKTAYLFPLACIIAGWTAGFLGVGGGLVQGPVLLHMGMNPQVATATSSFMILYTASSTTFQYALLGLINWKQGLWYGGIAFLGAILGQVGLAEFIKWTKKASMAVFLLAVLEVVSMLAIGGLGLYQMIKGDVSMSFRWLCH
eukprot:TRINITY_DN2393_c0_g1_i1.p1 TRINITY_DN2393_c0_g1~~TRINITY_DN2393_c0_g1_i1.p1  ORF type:complete len:375 (-),score=28.10 TRINITY_DN2393_c0_g1_i1:81-1205(-)